MKTTEELLEWLELQLEANQIVLGLRADDTDKKCFDYLEAERHTLVKVFRFIIGEDDE